MANQKKTTTFRKKSMKSIIQRKNPSSLARPKISLFLKKINQEMIRDFGSAAGCDFYVSWTKSCCILDFSLVPPEDLVSRPTKGSLIRKEPEGGMMWNQRTGAVYKLNETAYHAAIDIESGLSDIEVARRNQLPLKSVQVLFTKLRKLA